MNTEKQKRRETSKQFLRKPSRFVKHVMGQNQSRMIFFFALMRVWMNTSDYIVTYCHMFVWRPMFLHPFSSWTRKIYGCLVSSATLESNTKIIYCEILLVTCSKHKTFAPNTRVISIFNARSTCGWLAVADLVLTFTNVSDGSWLFLLYFFSSFFFGCHSILLRDLVNLTYCELNSMNLVCAWVFCE